MKTRLFLMNMILCLGFALEAKALTAEELTAIAQALIPSHVVQQEEPDREVVVPEVIVEQVIAIEKEPTALEIFYRLGQSHEKKHQSDPGRYEREAREVDRRIEILFPAEEKNNG